VISDGAVFSVLELPLPVPPGLVPGLRLRRWLLLRECRGCERR
jgi:hypothetical protein